MRLILKSLAGLLLVLMVLIAAFRVAAMLRETENRLAAMPEEGHIVQTRLGEVYVQESGPLDGAPVLLVHGSVGWSAFWYETSDALAQAGYRAIAFDLSPMGYSEPDPDHDYSRTMQAARIEALVDAMAIRPHLVAHSFGAGPATEAVLRGQARFASFTMIAGAIGLGAPETSLPLPLRWQWVREAAVSVSITNPVALKPLLKMFLHKKDAASDDYIKLLKQPYRLRGTTPAIAAWLPTLLVPPTGALSLDPRGYAEMTLPTRLIWGDKDTATPLEQGKVLHGLITGSDLVVLKDLGHIPQIEDPGAFQKALLTFLDAR